MKTGTYEEELPCGGKLRVTSSAWEISYYFFGPDLRYKGTSVTVHGSSIEQYISAFQDNWTEYETLRASIPSGGEFVKNGKMGMSIRISTFAPGVCLRSHHMRINSKQRLDDVIAAYRYAAQRALQIQALLATL